MGRTVSMFLLYIMSNVIVIACVLLLQSRFSPQEALSLRGAIPYAASRTFLA